MKTHLSYSLKALPIVLSCFLIFGLMYAERLFLPVTSDFQFTKMYRHVYVIEIEGVFRPKRNCQWVGGRFVGRDASQKESIIRIDRVGAHSSAYVGAGVEDIGVWSFEYNPPLPLETLEFIAYFKCHPFWITENVVAKFKAPR